jgi:hypothetical protein
MRVLSATDAFTPALERTKAMFSPFSLRLGLKLGLIALLAEMGSQFIMPPFGNGIPHSRARDSGISAIAGGITHQTVIAFAVIGVLIFLIGFLLFYFGSRMQFVLMDLVAYRTAWVGPSWRKHGYQTWPWIGVKIAGFILIFVVIGAVVALPFLHFLRSMSSNGGQPPNAAFFGNFLLFFTVIAGVVLVAMFCIWALRDFVLPFMVFEGATARAALSDAFKLVRREPGDVMLYFLMKFVLTIAAGIAAELCIFAAALVAAIPLALIGGALWFFLHNAGSFSTAFLYVSLGLLALIFLACMFVAIICIGGATLVFYQAYALYFLGGRIPALGNLLEPPPPPILEVAPPFSPA